MLLHHFRILALWRLGLTGGAALFLAWQTAGTLLLLFAGLLFVDKVGAGAFNGLLITANLLTSVALDHFGWLGMRQVTAGPQRLGGAALMVAGIVLISIF
mgnify:CR=1 FL=1